MKGVVPSGGSRKFRIELHVSFWWPSKGTSLGPDVKQEVLTFTVPKWKDIFIPVETGNWTEPSFNIGTNPLATGSSSVNPTLFLKNLFSLTADTSTPVLGQAVNMVLQQNKVVSSVHRRAQAALNTGAYWKDPLGSPSKAVPDDSESEAASNSAAEGINVQKTMSSAFSTPLAMSGDGYSTTKTTPFTSQEPLPVFEPVDSLARLRGTIPIGHLISKLTVERKALIFNAVDKKTKADATSLFRQVEGTSGLALSVIPIPRIIALRSGASTKEYSITIKILVSIQLPGASDPVMLLLPTAELPLTIPDITVPQIFMGFHDIGFQGRDVLYSPDPVSNSILTDADKVKFTGAVF